MQRLQQLDSARLPDLLLYSRAYRRELSQAGSRRLLGSLAPEQQQLRQPGHCACRAGSQAASSGRSKKLSFAVNGRLQAAACRQPQRQGQDTPAGTALPFPRGLLRG